MAWGYRRGLTACSGSGEEEEEQEEQEEREWWGAHRNEEV